MAIIPNPTSSSLCSVYNPEDIVYKGILSFPSLAGTPCYVTGSGQIVPSSSGTPAIAAVVGYLAQTASNGEYVTLLSQGTFEWNISPIPVAVNWFLASTGGAFDDTANGNSTVAVATAIIDNQVNETSKSRLRIRCRRIN